MRAKKAQELVSQKTLTLFLIVFFSFLLLTACTNISKDTSLLSKFDQFDTYYLNKQYNKAFIVLKKTEKKAHGVYNRLGVIKRALQLAKHDWAEELLQASLEEYPKSLELRAVYTHVLLFAGKYEQALVVGKSLKGSDYGSLYAEAVIRLQQRLQKDDRQWMQPHFAPLYIDLYKTTENDGFRINAALTYLLKGDYTKAFSFHPKTMSIYDNVFFWSLVSYDSQNWNIALDDLSYAQMSREKQSLQADIYIQMGNITKGLSVWNSLIREHPEYAIVSYLNAARQTRLKGSMTESYEYLKAALDLFPESIPVLTAWGDYALYSSQPFNEDAMSTVLRSAGLKTLAMQKRDAIPTIEPIDAVKKMKEVLAFTHNSELQLSCKKLIWNIENVSGDKRCADMWLLLERNRNNENGKYDQFLFRYAVWLLMYNGFYDEAKKLVSSVLIPSEGFDNGIDSEMYAWLLCKEKKYDDAVVIYETIPGLEREKKVFVSPVVFSYPALFNLGALYVARGEKIHASALYEKALEITKNTVYMAELKYRLACIKAAEGNISEALQLLQFSLKLNPADSRARLLQKKLML
ncbi:MAG TPA: tetratricopeptide repeat protein [Treponemataceae bacterium]|nr:tetratricopeptide repeat protein [Treponemataceae bacterium]